jgi:hypothetical protein
LFRTQHCKSFTDAKDKTGFSILSLIPPVGGKHTHQDDSAVRDAELLLGEASKNLSKVDTSINVNTTIIPSTGLHVCANIVLLCRVFAQVQSESATDDATHPTPFLFQAASELASHISTRELRETVAGNSEQAALVSYVTIACLDTIAACIGKEAMNLDMLRQARQDDWVSAPSLRFTAAHNALENCIQHITLAATGGAIFMPTMLYLDSDQKRRRDEDRMLATAKRLKLTSGGHSGSAYASQGRGAHTNGEPTQGIPSTGTRPPGHRPDKGAPTRRDIHPRAGDIIYAADGLMPMPEGQGRRFCAAFLRKGAACRLTPCPTTHKQINDLSKDDQKIWIEHVRKTPKMSFNEETVDKAIITAASTKEEPGEPRS